jgi:hypothetical protein
MITELVAHNGIDYDLLVLKALGLLDYEIDEFDSNNCSINGLKLRIVDTLVLSKTLNPDRYGGHSLDEWGRRVGSEKIDWRKKAIELGLIEWNAPKGAEFQQYHPEMLKYCAQDTLSNVHAYKKMMQEWGDWAWEGPFSLEQRTRYIITMQSHRGFWFDQELAVANVRDLDEKMESIRQVVEPLIPPKPMGITKLKEFKPPKKQFKKDGSLSQHMLNFIEKHGGCASQHEDSWVAHFPDSVRLEWPLPMDPEVPIKTHEPATVKDITHIKGWLVELGWSPSQYKERDLTCDAKKNKLPEEKYAEAVERYVEQTLASPFCKDRCEEIGVHPNALKQKLLRHDLKRPLKVYTNPTLTVGQDKDIDPALEALHDKFPHAKLISEFLTYSHRRNSILGGGVDPDDVDEDDEFAGKGFLALVREDGRIATPADTCGAGTSRFKHRVVANIPRITSLYGEQMRNQFGVDVDEGFVQMGYDFASLEAMIESHYCWRYDTEDGKPYCVSLTAKSPNDVHTITAAKVAAMIGQTFTRQNAKPVKYACAYGAQPKRVAKTVGCSEALGKLIHGAYWDAAKPLALLGEKLKEYWTEKGGKKYILGVDGRKIPTRSASALINSLFQSAGVICAKRAMVIHDRKLEAAGLKVDFWKDDWKSKKFVQQLIAYHK